MKGICIYRKFTTEQNNLLDKVLKYSTKRLIFSEKKNIFLDRGYVFWKHLTLTTAYKL